MSDRAHPSLLSRRALWGAAIGFWLFVAALSAVQIVWIARTPGQRVDLRAAMAWQTTCFLAWIPFTIAVWHITRGWLPEQFSGWLRLVIAHLPMFAAVALAHTFIVTLLADLQRRHGAKRALPASVALLAAKRGHGIDTRRTMGRQPGREQRGAAPAEFSGRACWNSASVSVRTRSSSTPAFTRPMTR